MGRSVIGIKNPFGKLKRIIVGIIDGAMVPELDISVLATMPQKYIDFFDKNGGKPFPKEYIREAKKELNNFIEILKSRGIIVDRPKKIDFSKPIITPYWRTKGGLYAAMPRDILLVIDNKIIVAPMSWRCRYREIEAYIDLLKFYKSMGYEVIFAPRPKLKDELYKNIVINNGDFISILNENEPVFDAADFIILNKIVITQESHVTNKAGIKWLKDILGKNYEICTIKTNDCKPMHIDATIIPLKEGLMLVNPERIDIKKLYPQLPTQLQTWEFIEAPTPIVNEHDPPKYMSSDWLNINILMIDSGTVIVEESQEPLVRLLKNIILILLKSLLKIFNVLVALFIVPPKRLLEITNNK